MHHGLIIRTIQYMYVSLLPVVVSFRIIIPTMVGILFCMLVGKPDTHLMPHSLLSFSQAMEQRNGQTMITEWLEYNG